MLYAVLCRFCRGCLLSCDEQVFNNRKCEYLAIDWDPTVRHLQYQSSLERVSFYVVCIVCMYMHTYSCTSMSVCLSVCMYACLRVCEST